MNYNDLIGKINKAKEDYYQNGRSQLTDQEYDALVAEAERMGYSETVGAAPVDNIKKITHEHPMLSLEKCHTVDEVKKFARDHGIIAMQKADGLTVSCTYLDGNLVRLETRGNGVVGNDIMFHAGSIENLPMTIDKTGTYVIDGECVILQKDFERINSTLPKEDQYSHPRNLAAGSLNQLDPTISKQRHLRFYAWDVIKGGEDTLSDSLIKASDLGFDIVNYIIVSKNTDDDIKAAIDYIKITSENESFPIDGVVFKFDNVSYGKSLGRTDHHFRSGIAFKYQDETYPTTLLNVEYQVGKTGQITPIAIFNSVYIDNVEINRASLSNISIMKKTLGSKPYFGQKIWVGRMNMVIPKVVKAMNEKGEYI